MLRGLSPGGSHNQVRLKIANIQNDFRQRTARIIDRTPNRSRDKGRANGGKPGVFYVC